ncbi:hypothetical protein M422DRAFT_90668, partial [Sphaerobolus stellatus SS14]
IQFYIVSAALPKFILKYVRRKLNLKPDSLIIQRSNDRWNCRLVVRKIQKKINTFEDLDFLVPKDWRPGQRFLNKFLIFFDSRPEAEVAAEALWNRHGRELKDHIVWFHAIMTDEYCSENMKIFKDG